MNAWQIGQATVSVSAVSSSTDPSAFKDYGPYLPGFEIVKYNDLSKVNLAFFSTNGIASIVFGIFVIIELTIY